MAGNSDIRLCREGTEFFAETLTFLIEAVRDHVRLQTQQSDGQTLLDHLEQVEKATGQRPPEMDTEEPPYNLLYLWEGFWELNQGRQSGMSGREPISWHDLRSWTELKGIELNAWELKAIKAMDSAYLGQVNKQKPKKSK